MSRLTPQQLGDVYLRRIQGAILQHRRPPPWRQPKVLFIVGQPGAGKSTMQAAAMQHLGMKNAYVLDHDELLDKHPNYAGAALDDDYAAAGEYGQDAAQWRSWALHDVQSRRMDVVLPYPYADLAQMKQFQELGYRVEVAFAAVHESQSQLGIMERFNDSRQEAGYGRWIGSDQHDHVYQHMVESADAIEAQGVADAVHVYRRGEAAPVFTNERKGGEWQHQPGSTRWAIETERNRPWTDREIGHFVRGWNKLSAQIARPMKDHFKAMPLMATGEGQRLHRRLYELAAAKIGQHQRMAEARSAAETARAQAARIPPMPQHAPLVIPPMPQHPPQAIPPMPQHAPQVVPPMPQHAPQVVPPMPQHPPAPTQAPGQGHDWQEFAVRLQSEQGAAGNISAPATESPAQSGDQATPPAHRSQHGPASGTTRDGHSGGMTGH
ncbi:zeta toxin family protein [Kribbella sp. NPDC026611]|uniref:zeta toxin family protein n=1 Tax=Kribbella sp. NPDC026611 TaxID=3154911 RepID=UPI0034103369